MDSIRSSQTFGPYLSAGERILWSGQPKQGLALGPKDSLLIPFSLLWGGFAIAWNAVVWLAPEAMDSGDGAHWAFKLWGLPFLLIGLYIIAGRFVHDARIRKSLFYAVTDRRILVLRGSGSTSLDIDRLPRLELSEHRDGTGTLAFEGGAGFPSGTNGLVWWLPALGGGTQFFRIGEARKVYELVRRQGRSAG